MYHNKEQALMYYNKQQIFFCDPQILQIFKMDDETEVAAVALCVYLNSKALKNWD